MSAMKVVLAGGALALAAGAAFAAAAPDAITPPDAPKAYVGEFCGPIALSDEGTGALMQHLSSWGAKGVSDAQADAKRPQDSDTPGQLFRFSDPKAPVAFVDRRRDLCSLVYPEARTPETVFHEFITDKLPVGEKDAPSAWRKVKRISFGPPGPIRYFLKVGASDGFGLCSTIFEDLRLQDGSPATMVRVSTCRLRPDEKLDNG
jgi:hypothetical protein